MIDEADESLEALLVASDLDPGQCDVVFDPPTADWAAARGSKKVLNLFLHSIVEQVDTRLGDWTDVRDDRGRVIERQPPLRRYDLAYLVTAWTGAVRDDHRLLSAALRCLAAHRSLPEAYRVGSLKTLGLPMPLYVAVPDTGAQSNAWDIWSALGTPPRAHLNVVVSTPMRLPVETDIAPEITTRRFAVGIDEGPVEDVASPARDKTAGAQNEAVLTGAAEEAGNGRARRPRRRGVEEAKKE